MAVENLQEQPDGMYQSIIPIIELSGPHGHKRSMSDGMSALPIPETTSMVKSSSLQDVHQDHQGVHQDQEYQNVHQDTSSVSCALKFANHMLCECKRTFGEDLPCTIVQLILLSFDHRQKFVCVYV